MCLPTMLHLQLSLTFGQFGSEENSKKERCYFDPAHERTVRASVNGKEDLPLWLLVSENPTPTETDFPQ